MGEKKDDSIGATRISRRGTLHGLGALGLAATACGGSTDAPDPTSPTPDGPSGPPQSAVGDPPPPAPGPVDPPAPALSPKELLAGIEHIVVLMMENRSFDHYLGALKTDPGYAGRAQIEGLDGDETNPAPDGTPVKVFKMTNFTPADPPHSWKAAHDQWAGGKNDGFVKAHAGASQDEAMGFHDRSQIPLYYWFADNFAVCDAWFSSVLGPTWPNRFYLHSTTSKGKKDNTPFLQAPDTIWDRLKAKGLSYKNYTAAPAAFYAGGYATKLLSLNPIARISEFFDAAKNGKLPAFSMIDPDFTASDDHPDHDILRGQAFVASIYKALAESPNWSKTLFIITYDENGGFYDHVAPPKTTDDDPEFERLGFRVPAFVIGPTVKKGYIEKKVLEHVSVAATLKTRFDIASLSKRMDVTNDVSSCIDPAKVKAPSLPPAGMPQVIMTKTRALTRGVGPWSQPMLAKMIDDGTIPATDDRPHAERIEEWLDYAVELGAVRVVGP